MAVSKLLTRAAGVAERFVQTVVLIDDEAFGLLYQTESGKVQKAEIDTAIVEPSMLPGDEGPLQGTREREILDKTLPMLRAAKQPAHAAERTAVPTPSAAAADLDAVLASGEKAVTAGFETATPDDVAQQIHAKKLVASFARLGLVCGVIEPDADEKNLDALLPAAKRSDVLIVDWVFHNDNGRTAQEIIRSVLSSDAPERLRLIVVYTGDPGVGKIIDAIMKTAGATLSKSGNNVLSNERTRIAVLSKGGSPKNRDAVLLEDLPKRVLLEFAELYCGLVTMAALEGVAALRSNTHQLLGRLHSRLDTAFLTHRMLLPHPDDSQEFLTDLVGQEIAALLHGHEIGNASNMDAIEEWFESAGDKLSKHATELASKVSSGEDVRRALVRDGVATFLEQRADKAKVRELEKLVHKSASKLFLDDQKKADASDQEFAHVCSMVGLYAGATPPRLGLGTVLMGPDGEFLVCIQPVCDCLRLKEPRRFLFLIAKKNSAPNMIVREGDKSIRLKVESKVASLVQYSFGPTTGKDVAYAASSENAFTFESTEAKKFTWKGQLKFAQAQRLAQQFSASLARVGLDESEWLRRFDRESDGGAVVIDEVVVPVEPEPRGGGQG